MYELGKKDDVLGTRVTELTPITGINSRPTTMPRVRSGMQLLCGLDRGLSENIYVCETLVDMQRLYDSYTAGMALRIYWYQGTVLEIPGMIVGELPADDTLARGIIDGILPEAPEEVRRSIASYAMGNPGVARVLSERSTEFSTATQVEELVGWPLAEHTLEKSDNLWDRYKD